MENIITAPPPSRSKRLHLELIPGALFRPRQTFPRILALANSAWFTPLLVITLMALVFVIAAGRQQAQAAAMGEVPLPPDFEYYSPEQQTQYMQAAQSTQGPVFLYVLPGIAAAAGIWIGWLLTGGLLHLVTTLLGGRGDTGKAMNLVAWAGLPFAVRSLVRAVYIFSTHKAIASHGISGFISTASGSGWVIFLNVLLGLFDIYLIWQVILIIIGVRSATSLAPSKAITSALITILVLALLQSGLGFLVAKLSGLTFTRPFFF